METEKPLKLMMRIYICFIKDASDEAESESYSFSLSSDIDCNAIEMQWGRHYTKNLDQGKNIN